VLAEHEGYSGAITELGGVQVEREERDLIEAGKLRATGFNYVGES
jgi:hypothetical protein